jgi:hypothetical protein
MIRALTLSVLVAVVGCGSSNSGKTPAQAQSDCTVFVSAVYCPRVVACDPPGAIDQPTCVSAANTSVGCNDLAAETSGLAACESDIGNMSCAELTSASASADVTLPASCDGVFLKAQ